ncbi:MAG: N-acetylmuramoyl-L-alanine amidase, partial [Halanaerobiales bacterium]
SRLVIDIPDIVVNEDEVEVSDAKGVIEKARVSQYSTNPHQGRVVLELNKSVNVVKDVVDNSLHFKLSDFDLDDKVITLDPGHGGQDPGALGHSEIYEKNPVLEIALRLEKLLENAGAEVIMTRSTDEFISLEERVKLANKMNSDIFVSIHLNGHHSSGSFGTETFIAPDGKKNSKLLGQFMQASLVEQLGTFDRGVKEEELYVLEQANMPAVLEEVLFISNKESENKIKQEGFKDEAAVAMYKGISKYFELLAEEEI